MIILWWKKYHIRFIFVESIFYKRVSWKVLLCFNLLYIIFILPFCSLCMIVVKVYRDCSYIIEETFILRWTVYKYKWFRLKIILVQLYHSIYTYKNQISLTDWLIVISKFLQDHATYKREIWHKYVL